MAVKLRPLDDASASAWDAFVTAMPDGTFFHRAAWSRVITAAFGHRCHYMFAEQDGAITGVLPLAHVRTRLFGNTLISTPFCVYGGPVAADRESAAALEAHAETLRAKLGATAVELRDRRPPEDDRGAAADGWQTRSDLYVTFRRPITGDDDRNMKAIPRKQRAMVRKGIQNGLVSVCNSDVAGLHRVYAESVRNLGTPVFSRRYFAVLAEMFADCSDVVTILDDGQPLAAVMNFYFRDEVLPYYGGGTAQARQRAGNDFMYWEVMRRAAARGSRLFDFGRSKLGTGAFAFKHNWGFEPEKLHYRFHLAPGAAIPDLNPLNPKYRLFIAAWKRLPLAVANLLGPPIVRGLG
ncbi:MAG: FemAB family XrtA/PEP-CTERM system-associated protein [Acetobacteraceae bacterium]